MPIAPKSRPPIEQLASELMEGKKSALAKAITMVESQLPTDQKLANQLFKALEGKYESDSKRIGITGVPGVGKSTFIEMFGLKLVEQGNKVAVLSIDPSSAKTKGSLLGDKSRMDVLSREKNAFIRPSPTSGYGGGIGRKTKASVALCEAAGYNWILIETVGTGQNEYSVSIMADLFILLLLPSGGDELQGIKRGIMEMADAVLVNKADTDLKTKAELTLKEYASAIKLLPAKDNGLAIYTSCLSSTEGTGINEFIDWVHLTTKQLKQSGWWAKHRIEQDKIWFLEILKTTIFTQIMQNPFNQFIFKELTNKIESEGLNPEAALLSFFKSWKQN